MLYLIQNAPNVLVLKEKFFVAPQTVIVMTVSPSMLKLEYIYRYTTGYYEVNF